jgi:hypothetical protein
VLDYLDSSNSCIQLNPSFIREAQDWELKSFDSFLNLLYSSKNHPGEMNGTLWTPASNHDFEVKSYFKTSHIGDLEG